MKKVFFFLLVGALPSLSWASGCDYSCWSYNDEILLESRADGTDYFVFSGSAAAGIVQITPKPDRNVGFDTPIVFKGIKWKSPLDPELVDRILNKKFSSTVTKANVKIRVTDYMGGVTTVKTGQYRLEILFKTGESVTLYEPSFDRIIEEEDGSIRYENLLPLFFQSQ